MDFESVWDTQQRHCRQPSQRWVNLPSPEEPITYQQAVADITVKSASSVRCHERKANGKAWDIILENKLPSVLPRSVFVANFRLITGHLDGIGFRVSPKHLLCGDSEETGRDHFQRCQSLADTTDNINNPGRYLKL